MIHAVAIYPNPASDNVNFIYNHSESELQSVMLFDINGRLVRSYPPSELSGREALTNTGGARLDTVPLDGVSKGVYVLIVENDRGDHIEKQHRRGKECGIIFRQRIHRGDGGSDNDVQDSGTSSNDAPTN